MAAAAPRLGPADWLSLAAAPTFALMTAISPSMGSGDYICSPGDASPLGGMAPMYMLMATFHSTAWLKLLHRRRRPCQT